MLASIVYKLKAINKASIPKFHGRKMHAVFYSILSRYNEELATAIHEDSSRARIFSLSQLIPVKKLKSIENKRNKSNGRGPRKEDFIFINENDSFFWRINLLDEALLPAVLELPIGKILSVENLELSVEEIICDGRKNTGILELEELLADAAASAEMTRSVTISFDSPTTFRKNEDDYPFPLPDMLYGSLAVKWRDMGVEWEFDVDTVKEIALKLLPQEWQGNSERVYFAGDRGALCFRGKITFSLKRLNEEEKSIILLLTSFATFIGVGRLTGQGFGQVSIMYH